MDAECILPAFSRDNGVTITKDLQAEFAAYRREVIAGITLLVSRFLISSQMWEAISEGEKDAV